MPTPGSTGSGPEGTGDVGKVLLGRYRIEKVLGRGGMGEVLLAHDTLLHRKVALKHLRTDGSQGGDPRSAILKEARRATQVGDRRIAAIHDVLDLGNDVLIVMEYVEGSTLREHLREPFPLERFWEISRECLAALGTAHAHGVIHRDIKPENLMLTSEREVKILDFGLALRSASEGPATSGASTQSVDRVAWPAGTPAYMAPEAHYGGSIDQRTDIFSLGAVFYEMLTARHPFAAAGHEDIRDAIMNRVPPPIAQWNPAVPDALSSVVQRMLERDPAKRYASCADVAAALAGARAGGTGAVTEPVHVPVPAVARSRAPTAILSLAMLALAVAGTLAWNVFRSPALPRDRLVAILPPRATSTPTDFEAFTLGSLELLVSRLRPFQLERGFQLNPFFETYNAQPATAQEARSLLGANLVLEPHFEQNANRLHGRLELRDGVEGRRIDARRFEVTAADPAAFEDSLFSAAVALLRLPRGARAAIGVRGAGTLRYLAQGIGRVCAEESQEVRARARADLEAACRAEPDAAIAHAWLATAELRMRADEPPAWIQRAEASARRAVALDSGRADAHHVLGSVLVFQKRDREALFEFRRATELDPTRDESWRSYGLSHRRLGHPEGERAVYEAAIARRPHAYRPRWWLAAWEFERGHIDAAIQGYREMIVRAPAFEKGYATLGGVLMMQGEYRRAIDTLKLAVALRPGATAYTNLGSAYFYTGEAAAAVEAYNQALQFGDPNYALWQNLGDAYYWLQGDPERAKGAYAQAVVLGRERMQSTERIQAPDGMIPANLACVYSKLGQPDSARALLAIALAEDSANVMVQYCAALTHWDLRERARALDWLERAIAGGYPIQGLRDSPVHREWKSEPRFRALLASNLTSSLTHPPR